MQGYDDDIGGEWGFRMSAIDCGRLLSVLVELSDIDTSGPTRIVDDFRCLKRAVEGPMVGKK